MSRKTAFIKVSGDLVARDDVLSWLRWLTEAENYFAVICIGGGSQINEAFKAQGLAIEFGPLGRETNTFNERQLARNILEQNQAEIQDLLAEYKVQAQVIIPVLDIGTVLCHVNGDIFAMAAYLGFDKVYILTLQSRLAHKEREYKPYPKVTVVGFSDLLVPKPST